MELPFDVIDYIFSFLQSDPESLVACSEAHPVFFKMVEKYQYHDIHVHTRDTAHDPSHLATLLSHTPHIANHIRVLRIEFSGWKPLLTEIAPILPKLPLLSSIWLMWQDDLPQVLQTDLKNCLHSVPSLRQLHIRDVNIHLSTLDNLTNLDCLSIATHYLGIPSTGTPTTTAYPQFKSLCVFIINDYCRNRFSSWAKHRILRLESLTYIYSGDPTEVELLKVCSGTLTNLDLHLIPPSVGSMSLIDLSSLPRLRHLTVRTSVEFERALNVTAGTPTLTQILQNPSLSFLPATIQILNTLNNNNNHRKNHRAPSLQTITIEIIVSFSNSGVTTLDDLGSDLDLSPLAALVAVEQLCASLERIDVYISSSKRNVFTHHDVDSLLAARVSGLKTLIERGVLVVYPEERAPSFLDNVH